MASRKLVSYIRDNLQKGYSLKQIKNYLVDYGYDEYEIEGAINEIYGRKEVRHIIHFSPATLITLISVFLGLTITVGVVFFFVSDRGPQQLLDLNLESVKTTAKQGEEITFIVDVLNLGSGARYDIFLRHELISAKTSEVVNFKEETRGIETSGSKQTSIEVPQDAEPGNYVLRTIATYNGNRAVATLQAKVEKGETSEIPVEKPKIEEPVIEEPKIEVIETKPEIKTAEGSEIEGLTSFEALDKIKEIAKTDKSKAAGLCQKLELQTSRDLCFNNVGEVAADRSYCTLIQDERTKDVCFSNVARVLKRSEICEEVSKDSRKDSCYMNFVVDFRDYSVCDKVTNQYLKQSCNSLKQLSELNQTNIAFYEALINQTLLGFG